MDVLDIVSLKKKYYNFELDISFKIRKGEFVALIGPNGTGKSTTMGTILNMVKKDSGQVKIFGLDHIEFETEIKEKMGIILENQYFYRNIKIKSILKFYSGFYPKWDWDKVEVLREKFDLKDNKKFKELSKGMKVKLAFIIALSTGASFLLFDEPTSGLDPAVRHILLSEVQKLKEDKDVSLLFTSHIMSDIEYFADRIIFLDMGKIVFDESKNYIENNWKRIKFKSTKKIVLSHLETNIFKLNIENDIYKIITKNNPIDVLENLKSLTGLDIEMEDISLNELFVEIASNEEIKSSKEL